MTTLNPFSSNFTYAQERDRALNITKEIITSILYVAQQIAVLAGVVGLMAISAVSIIGIFSFGFTPIGAGLFLAGITGIAMACFINFKLTPAVVSKTYQQIVLTHNLIWN